MSKTVIELQNIKRNFQVGDETVHALRGVSFCYQRRRVRHDYGYIRFGKIDPAEHTRLSGHTHNRRVSVGRDFRTHHEQVPTRRTPQPQNRFRFPELQPAAQDHRHRKRGASANVQLVRIGLRTRSRAIEALKAVSLGDRLEHKSNQMSGGQMQRVAIARALVNDPAVILADEATGNLDTRTSFEILVLFQKLHAEGRTIIFVTHNPEIAQYSSRNIVLRDGQVKDDKVNPDILNAAETLAALPKQEDD